MVDQLADLFRTTHKVKTQQVAKLESVNKDLNDVSHRLDFSLLGAWRGIHVEEGFNPCIRVDASLSPSK